MKYHDQPFIHSFMLLPGELNIDNLSDYHSLAIHPFKLVHSESVSVMSVGDAYNRVIVLGYALDIRNGQKSQHEIMEDLLAAHDFEAELEYINGRFIIIKCSDDTIDVYSDASNLLPMNYHVESHTLASHDMLLANTLSDNGFTLTRRPLTKTNDLDFTRYEEIWKYNPSLKLNMNTFSFTRIYPRTAQIKVSVEEAFHKMKPYLDEMRLWLKGFDGDIFLSMTAGVDSRVSASLVRELREQIEFLTYITPQKVLSNRMAKMIYKIDREVVNNMTENLGWNHTMADLGRHEPSDMDYFKDVLNSKHSHRLAQYYRDRGFYKALHIKSTVFGVGKGDYPRDLDAIRDVVLDYKKVVGHFQKDFYLHYDEETEKVRYLSRNLITDGVTKGRHYFELFHLESRLANWHSALTSETDPETDEFIFLNTRKMIDLFTSIDVEEMRRHKLHKRIIKEYWGVLNYFGVNRLDTLWEAAQANEADFVTFGNVRAAYKADMHIETNVDMVQFYPNPGRISALENYEVTLYNTTSATRHVKLTTGYKKESGRGLIFVTIKGERLYARYDVLDLNDGAMITLEDTPVKISIDYMKSFDKISWKHAGRIYLAEE